MSLLSKLLKSGFTLHSVVEILGIDIQGHERITRIRTMPHYLVERSLSRSKSRRWKQLRTSTIFLIIAILALSTWAWVSMVYPSHSFCVHPHRPWPTSSTLFPWDATDLDAQHQNESFSSDLIWHRDSLDMMQDLNMSQLLFNIAGAAKLWPRRKEYVKLWWRPTEMRGFVWLEDHVKEDHGAGLPIVKVSEDIRRFSYTNPTGHPSGVRIARIIQEAFKQDLPDIRWFILGDDDTIFAADNLLQVLRKYDSRELYYIGNPSESHSSNTYFSHGMSFGGGGIAISYPLAKTLSSMLDECLERYPFLFGSDDRLHACISELGVPLTKEPGFHQFDVHGNAFGLLAAHPIAPFISLHHLDEISPVFPQHDVLEGLHHLTKAMRTEPSSFLQRCICYDQERRLTFSISSGYVVQVFPHVVLPRDLERAEITFKAWNKKDGGGEFDFDTRSVIKSICDKPFLFFLDHMYREGSDVVSIYKREQSADSQKRWSFCFVFGSRQSDMQQIKVLSKPMDKHWFKVPRRQCGKVRSLQNQELGISMGSCQLGRDRSV